MASRAQKKEPITTLDWAITLSASVCAYVCACVSSHRGVLDRTDLSDNHHRTKAFALLLEWTC